MEQEQKIETQGNQSGQIDLAELQRYTNSSPEFAGLGSQVPPAQLEPESQEKVVEQGQPQAPAQTEPQKQEEPPKGQASTTSPELKSILDGTPYKGDDIVEGVKKLASGYSELQGTWTKEHERVKPYMPLIDAAEKKPVLKQVLKWLEEADKNPSLLEPYMNPQSDVLPDPNQYEVWNPEGLQKYRQAEAEYMQKMIDGRINTQLSSLQEAQIREKQKLEFKQKFPDYTGDLDSLFNETMSLTSQLNPLEIAYKLKNWDSRDTTLTERIRSQLTTKMNEASKATPEAPSAKQEEVKVEDIMRYMVRYGPTSAQAKFGKEAVMKVMRNAPMI